MSNLKMFVALESPIKEMLALTTTGTVPVGQLVDEHGAEADIAVTDSTTIAEEMVMRTKKTVIVIRCKDMSEKTATHRLIARHGFRVRSTLIVDWSMNIPFIIADIRHKRLS